MHSGKVVKNGKDPRICILIHVSLANIRYIVNLHCLRLVGSFELGLRCSALCDSVCKQKTYGVICVSLVFCGDAFFEVFAC